MNSEFSEIELRKLDLNLLLVFSAVMRERSVGRAASRLFLGPSAVSMALARLRTALEDELFVRGATGMEPTPQAVALWDNLEPALESIERAVRASRSFSPATARATIRFAAPDDLEFVLVPLLIERLSIEAPLVKLVLRPADFRTLLQRLDDGDADVALSASPASGIDRRHRILTLYCDTFSALYDSKRLDLQGPLDLPTYLDVPHLLLSVTGDLEGPVDEALGRLGLSRQVMAAVSHFPTAPFILKRCRALVNMPSTAARYYAEAYNLELSPLPVPSPDFEVSLVWHARTDSDPAQIWFRGLVADVIRGLRDDHALSARPASHS